MRVHLLFVILLHNPVLLIIGVRGNMIFVVGGIMRSGKSIFSQRIVDELGFSHIPTDHLIIALQKALPNIEISQRGLSYDELCK
jgi:predicted kinase